MIDLHYSKGEIVGTTPKRAVFLDRDGTINREAGYVDHPDRFELLPKVGPAVSRLNQAGLSVVVVSNQSGVGRGLFSLELLNDVDMKMKELLAWDGANLDGIYYCPHHPEAKVSEYRKICDCRKPNPGLLQKASSDLNLDPTRSFMVGDKVRDLKAGWALGTRSILVLSGYGASELNKIMKNQRDKPDHVAQDLAEAADWILDQID